tara:strand:+ start:120247 stop:121353 length:1107 start_codon:yes stop_codon:yes gene_type:complete
MLWLYAALMTLAVIAIILWPLLRPTRRSMDRADYDLAIYRDQLDEVERDLARGVIDAEQAEAARTEIKRRILAADAERNAISTTARRPALAGAILIALILPIGAVAVYLPLGNPDLPAQPLTERREAAAKAAGAGSSLEFKDAIEQLRQRLLEDPESAEGWTLLARSLTAMKRHAESVPAFRRARELSPDNVGLMTDFGETLMIIHNGEVTEEALQLFLQVLEKSPDHPAAVYYVGLSSVQKGMVTEGMARWAALARKAPPGAEWLPFLEDQMRQLAANSDATLPDDMTAPATGGPTREQMEAAQEMTPEERLEMIRSMVDGLEARLKEEPDDLAGWQRLARAWRVLGETAKAEIAEQRIRELQQSQQ